MSSAVIMKRLAYCIILPIMFFISCMNECRNAENKLITFLDAFPNKVNKLGAFSVFDFLF
jgi:hypothetical protein